MSELGSAEEFNPEPAPALQGMDFDPNIVDPIVYTPNPSAGEPQFRETRAVFIGNLRPEFDHTLLRAQLDRLAEEKLCTIDRAWLNSHFTHALVIVSDVPGAENIRQNMNDTQIDPFGPLNLYVEFVPVKAVSMWIEQEVKGPKDGIWEVAFERAPSKINPGEDYTVVAHRMVNKPNNTWGYRSSRLEWEMGRARGRGRSRGGRGRGRGRRGHRDRVTKIGQ